MAGIHERIKEMRLKRGFTLLEVAEHIGVKEATVQRYESGSIKTIKHEIICKLGDFFNCDPCYLMGWSTNINADGAIGSTITNSAVVQGNNATILIIRNGGIHEHEISDQAVELLRIFEALNVKEQIELLSFAFKLEEKTNDSKTK